EHQRLGGRGLCRARERERIGLVERRAALLRDRVGLVERGKAFGRRRRPADLRDFVVAGLGGQRVDEGRGTRRRRERWRPLREELAEASALRRRGRRYRREPRRW